MRIRRSSPHWFVAAILAVTACERAQIVAPEEGREASPAGLVDATIPSTRTPSGRAAVVFRSETSIPEAGLDLVATLGGTVTTRLDGIGVLFASGLPPAQVAVLQQSPLVSHAGPDYVVDWLPDEPIGGVASLEVPARPASHDPTEASQFRTWQWGPQRISADRVWASGRFGDPDVRVAILDTGIDDGHRELRGLVDLTRSASFVENEPNTLDLHFHGTHVASTVATNSVTIAGIAPHTTLIAVKVLSFEGSGTFEGVVGGIMHATDVDAHVVNMSLGAVFDRNEEGAAALIEAMRRAVRYAGKRGTLVVAAAGNDEIDFDQELSLVSMPCMVSHLCVSATGPLNGQFDENGPVITKNHDRPAYYTNYGFRAVHVAAPGGNANPADPDQVEGTWRDEDLVVGACSGTSTVVPQCAVNNDVVAFYVFAGGTSMATPHVSGAAALIQAKAGGTLSTTEVVNRLLQSADDIGAPGTDPYSNYGRINVRKALR